MPYHSFGDEVAERVCSYALCKYSTGLGSDDMVDTELTEASRSASRAQKCSINLDHKLESSAQLGFTPSFES